MLRARATGKRYIRIFEVPAKFDDEAETA
jgi:hypothetical protein